MCVCGGGGGGYREGGEEGGEWFYSVIVNCLVIPVFTYIISVTVIVKEFSEDII